MTPPSAAHLGKVLVEVADTLVDDFDLFAFLYMVTERCAELVDARAVGLLLADANGDLQVMAASDERIRQLELFQLQADDGPCREAYADAVPVVAPDLAEAMTRWPGFTPHAVGAGHRSVHAVPLRLRRTVIGAMGLFGDTPGRLSPEEISLVQALADVATIGLLQQRTIHESEQLSTHLQTALDTRATIEQAKGAIAELYSISVDEAFHLLRRYARHHGLNLRNVAAAMLARPDSRPDLRAL